MTRAISSSSADGLWTQAVMKRAGRRARYAGPAMDQDGRGAIPLFHETDDALRIVHLGRFPVADVVIDIVDPDLQVVVLPQSQKFGERVVGARQGHHLRNLVFRRENAEGEVEDEIQISTLSPPCLRSISAISAPKRDRNKACASTGESGVMSGA